MTRGYILLVVCANVACITDAFTVCPLLFSHGKACSHRLPSRRNWSATVRIFDKVEASDDKEMSPPSENVNDFVGSLLPEQPLTESVNGQSHTPPPKIPPDSPDRALSIVSELKANAALFAAFAYGGLSLPSLLTVTESKVVSVTSSVSTARPLPGNDLIQAFVVLDAVTLCLMISCVAASQLLIYRLNDGSWYEGALSYEDEVDASQTNEAASNPQSTSAMGRLVNDYKWEFIVARTTFDLGLVVLLLAVAVRAIAMFDLSISEPVVILLGGTCGMLAIAYLQSYWQVFRKLEKLQTKPASKRGKVGNAVAIVPALLAGSVALSVLLNDDVRLPFLSTTTGEAPAQETTVVDDLKSKLESYSSAAGDRKLKLAVESVAEEKASRKGKSKDTGLTDDSKYSTSKEAKNDKSASESNAKKSAKQTDEKTPSTIDGASTTAKSSTP